jgi:hypothetical protein
MSINEWINDNTTFSHNKIIIVFNSSHTSVMNHINMLAKTRQAMVSGDFHYKLNGPTCQYNTLFMQVFGKAKTFSIKPYT